MPLSWNKVDARYFYRTAKLPYSLRLKSFEMAMQDIYDFFCDVNLGLIDRQGAPVRPIHITASIKRRLSPVRPTSPTLPGSESLIRSY